MLERKFRMTAELEAHVGDFKIVGDVGGDLFQIPGSFRHPMHGAFELAFLGDPPKLLVRHPNTNRVGYVEIQPMLEALGKELMKKIN